MAGPPLGMKRSRLTASHHLERSDLQPGSSRGAESSIWARLDSGAGRRSSGAWFAPAIALRRLESGPDAPLDDRAAGGHAQGRLDRQSLLDGPGQQVGGARRASIRPARTARRREARFAGRRGAVG